MRVWSIRAAISGAFSQCLGYSASSPPRTQLRQVCIVRYHVAATTRWPILPRGSLIRVSRHPLHAWQVAWSVVLAVCLATVPTDWLSVPAVASDSCTTTGEVRATTCRLADGQTAEATLDDPGTIRTYRVDALTADTALELQLRASGGSTRVTVTNWRGETLGSALSADDAPDARTSVKLPLPGAYGVTVSGDAPASSPTFQLRATITAPTAAGRAVWPAGLSQPDAPLTGERQIVRTPRGGTPQGGVAVARALGSPPDGIVSDFTLVADVQFEQVVGPSALTVRFRYEPEAGGGTGYVLSIDPFGGVVSLDSFEEGQRRPIVTHRPLPMMPTPDAPNRLILRASGPNIAASLDGLPILEATDSRYSRGLIAVGVVTWSDPVSVTFDHLQVTTPAP